MIENSEKGPFPKAIKKLRIDPVQVEAAIDELKRELSIQTLENKMNTQDETSTKKPATAKKPVATKKKVAPKKTPSAKNVEKAEEVSLSDIAKEYKVDAFLLRKALRESMKKPGASWRWPKGHSDIKVAGKVAASLTK